MKAAIERAKIVLSKYDGPLRHIAFVFWTGEGFSEGYVDKETKKVYKGSPIQGNGICLGSAK